MVLAIFYRAVVQSILLYGSETSVLLASMTKRVEDTYTEFLQLITGMNERRLGDGTWETSGVEGVQEAAGTQSVRTYIEQWRATVAQWVALSSSIEMCTRETGYVGGGCRREAWWCQEATEKQLRATMADS